MTTFTTLQGMFVDALNDALVGAEKAGKYVPILECVHLVGDKGAETILLEATDRFVLVQRIIPVDEPLAGDFNVTLHRPEVETLAGVLKLTAAQKRLPTGPLSVTVDEAYVTATPHGRGGIAVPLAEHGEFPRLGSIVDRAMQADAAIDLLPVNLGFLTRVSKLSAAKARHGVAHIRFTKSGRAMQDRPEMVVLDFDDEGSTRVIVMAARTDR